MQQQHRVGAFESVTDPHHPDATAFGPVALRIAK
ncbi:hypothetical protein MycrhDRAFT_1962 [Mycolicibacterium rhodesiae JS60]|nr:hypothetical protein MycrhDRAFT_1962 [Mycolicibacterium rhodesiae JS60]